MNSTQMKTALLFLGLSLCGTALTAIPQSEAPFVLLESLKGTWIAQPTDGSKPIEVVYDVGSKGSIVTERFGKELTVFHKDGDRLVMTHFCNAGNQPRLRLRTNTDVGTLTFDFYDITNLPHPEDAHVNEVSYHFRTPDVVDGTWTWKAKGVLSSEKYVLTRLVAPATDK